MLLPKISINKILFATDLSEYTLQAFAYAVNLSNICNAEITIVHALEDFKGMEKVMRQQIGRERWEKIKKENEEGARNIIIAKQREDDPSMKEALKYFYKNVSENFENQSYVLDEIVVKREDPVDLIIKTAESKKCDIIVMGTQGLGKLARMLIGNTAKKVIQNSKIPVLVVRLPTEDEIKK